MQVKQIFRGFRHNLDERIEMIIIFESLMTTFEVSSIFLRQLGSIKNWLVPKINPANQVKLLKISDTHTY